MISTAAAAAAAAAAATSPSNHASIASTPQQSNSFIASLEVASGSSSISRLSRSLSPARSVASNHKTQTSDRLSTNGRSVSTIIAVTASKTAVSSMDTTPISAGPARNSIPKKSTSNVHIKKQFPPQPAKRA